MQEGSLSPSFCILRCIPTLYDPLFLPSAPPSDEVFIPAEDWKMRGRSSSLNSLSRVGPLVGASREEY